MSTGILSYDLNLLLAAGQGSAVAVLERDMAVPDAYGADNRPDWQTLATVPCVVWLDKSTGTRSANREYITPARTAPVSNGGLIVPPDTDVTEDDRVVNLLDHTGAVWIAGLFVIGAILNLGTHIEVYITRSHLGA